MKEEWKDIDGYQGIYKISSYGRVKSFHKIDDYGKKIGTRKNKILKPCANRDGYMTVNLFKNGIRKNHKVHRLVAIAFLDNPHNKPDVNHIKGNKFDNRLSKLEWVTESENILHSLKIGIHKRSSNGMFN